MEKIFTIQELKNEYINEWRKENEIEEFDKDEFNAFREIGVENFLDFIEDKWNKEHK